MITIHWMWIPLIVYLILSLIAWVADGFKPYTNSGIGMIAGMLAGLVGDIAFFFYILLGLSWLITHVNIVS